MRLIKAVLISAAIHIAAVFFIPSFIPITKLEHVNIDGHALQVLLKASEEQPSPSVQLDSITTKVLNQENDAGKKVNKNFKPHTDSLQKSIESSQEKTTTILKGFYSTKEVEMKALPISNLDISMFNGQFISGLPIKMRLYINASGSVVKIERLEILEQDAPLANRLEALLYTLTFLPARKDSLAVNSYQDVAFSF